MLRSGKLHRKGAPAGAQRQAQQPYQTPWPCSAAHGCAVPALQLWRNALEKPGDTWELFQCCQGQFPTVQQAAAFDCLVLSGGHYSAYDEEPWIQKLRGLLPQYADAGVRMFGCCFGCQVLAHSLGGRVGPNPSGRFVLTIERIRALPGLAKYPALAAAMHEAFQQVHAAEVAAGASAANGADAVGSNEGAYVTAQAPKAVSSMGEADEAQMPSGSSNEATKSTALMAYASVTETDPCSSSGVSQPAMRAEPCLCLMESHGDQVLQLPPGAIALATSDTAQYEMWALGSNILATQFHVEFDCALAQEKIWQKLSTNGRLTAGEAAASLAALNGRAPDAAAMVAVIQAFMRQSAAAADASGRDAVPAGMHGNEPGGSTAGGSSARAAGNWGRAGCSGAQGATGTASSGEGPGNEGGISGRDAPSTSAKPEEGRHASNSAFNTTAGASMHTPDPSLRAASIAGHQPAPGPLPVEHNTTNAGVADVLYADCGSTRQTNSQQPEPPTQPQEPSQLSSLPTAEIPLSELLQLPHHSSWDGPSSPSAMSEVSGSVAAAVPFSYLAKQRQQAERELSTTALTHQIVNDTSAAISARMEAYGCDYQLLAQLNAAASADVGSCADVSAALGQFAADLTARQVAFHEALTGALPELNTQLRGLEAAVSGLDRSSIVLENWLAEAAAATARPSRVDGSIGSSYSMSSLYQTLQQQLPRMGSYTEQGQ